MSRESFRYINPMFVTFQRQGIYQDTFYLIIALFFVHFAVRKTPIYNDY